MVGREMGKCFSKRGKQSPRGHWFRNGRFSDLEMWSKPSYSTLAQKSLSKISHYRQMVQEVTSAEEKMTFYEERVLLLSEVKSLKIFFDGKESIACSPCRELQKLKFDLRFLPHSYSWGRGQKCYI